MGVVRREGEWRLEKVEEGLYDVTYDKTVEANIITSDYEPAVFNDRSAIGVPSYEADSPSEAKDIFDEIVANGSTSAISSFGPAVDSNIENRGAELRYSGGEVDENLADALEDLPPGGFALTLSLTGLIVLYSSSFTVGSPAFYLGSGMVMVGGAIFGWAAVLFSTSGAGEAWDFLTTVDSDEESSTTNSESNGETKRTPPAPQSLKDELYFDRADQQCEWCGERVDQPEVHHIEPRSEGGPNKPSNLIVLCPGCHAKADRGGISKTKLRSKVRRLTEST
ncbi:HNH endonuclease [Natrinema marinum]|uniref:HNH endonuclease n=1 Tax=Natrinema marinum TaxID=2961598 RepID=UPI0020C844FA|nr:HNH endonuclease signature motif containing protein [Natrinema marinum]